MKYFLSLVFILAGLKLQAQIIESPHFFKITKGKRAHYLLGTNHYFVHWNELNENIHKKFNDAPIFILEVSIEDDFREDMDTKLSSIKKRKKLPFTDEQIKIFKEAQIPEALFPFSLEDDCELYFVFPHKGEYPYYLIDFDLYFRALDAKKKVITLDTPKLIKKAKSLEAERSPNEKCTVGQLIKDKTGKEIFEFGKRAKDDYRKGPGFYRETDDLSITYRTEKWMPQIFKHLKDETVFIAVGVGHLYGKKGMIHFLKEKGYTVEQVK